jgi:Transposase
MKRSKVTDEQISYVLRQVEGGTAVADVCRQVGISEAPFRYTCAWARTAFSSGQHVYCSAARC